MNCCKVENGLHLMPGNPDWMFFTGIGLTLFVSFLIFFKKNDRRLIFRFDLAKISLIGWMLKRRWLQFVFQLPIFLLFLVILYAGLFGNSQINIAPVLTWTIWWGGLIFAILLFGKIWCFVCPWDFIASLVSRLRFWNVNKEPLSLNLKWPKYARNITLAIGLFIILTWLELGYKVTSDPLATAIMGLAMTLLVVIPILIFEKKSFCRYGCLVGRISGLYANVSPIEIRSKNHDVCLSCFSKDCYNGNSNGYPCPTGLNLTGLNENTYCIMCTECFKSCPEDNVALNIRPFASDILDYRKPRLDEAVLAVILLSLTSFHGLSMTPVWEDLTNGGDSIISTLNSFFGLGPLFSFTVGMAGILLVPFLLYLLLCKISEKIADNGMTTKGIFVRFSYSLIPIALFYHLAHNGMHVAMEGQMIIPLLSDPFGFGWNLFGTVGKTYPMLLGDTSVWIIQVLLVVTGHIIGIKIAANAGEQMFGTGGKSFAAQLPLLIAMVLFSFISLWIMHLDMNMRTSMM